MSRSRWCLAGLVVAGTCASVHAAVSDPSRAQADYARLNRKLSAQTSLAGELVYEQNGRKTVYAFRLMRPNYSWVSNDRFESHGDGKTEWFYMKSSRQYESQPAGREMAPAAPLYGLEAFLGPEQAAEYRAVSSGYATFAKKTCRKIVLAPKDGKGAVRLYVDDTSWLPVGFTTEEPGPTPKSPKLATRGEYRALRTNPALTAKSFAWKPPRGATKMDDPAAALLRVGAEAPMFTLRTHDGKPLRLADVVRRNKATVVNFWFYG